MVKVNLVPEIIAPKDNKVQSNEVKIIAEYKPGVLFVKREDSRYDLTGIIVVIIKWDVFALMHEFVEIFTVELDEHYFGG